MHELDLRGRWYLAALAFGLLACNRPEPKIRDKFSKMYECPAAEVAVTARRELNWGEISKNPYQSGSGYDVFEASGCGKRHYFACWTSRTMTNGEISDHYSCVPAPSEPK
ncbi:hypothetical protein [Myxococcus virescens]|uniref:Lipoprotein n=1 Tax=Myxococcus virescens TaxID=83456 RepID=A0A511HPL3_9BACT|nr:hypothetical protein [Myxococcus virescens]GEL75533.1 hypothetical protein MVI01_73170 [Myxococcus virescens]SDF27054.1 hypothetical protein SAMN04488504_12727 [Myxococcus virescens]